MGVGLGTDGSRGSLCGGGGVVDAKVCLLRMIGGVVEAWFDQLLTALSVRKFAAGQHDLNSTLWPQHLSHGASWLHFKQFLS